jgi:hypothetical protein
MSVLGKLSKKMEDISILPEFNNNDIHYNIFRYLDKKWGLLNKKLRNLWLQKEGIAVHYNHVNDVVEKDYLLKNVTDLHLKYAGKIELEDLLKMTRLKRIFIYNLRASSILCTECIKEIITSLTSIENNRRKYPNFVGIFLDSRSDMISSDSVPSYMFFNPIRHISKIFSGLSNWFYISTYIYRGRIYTNIDQIKKLDNLLELSYYDNYARIKVPSKYQYINLKYRFNCYRELVVRQESEALLVHYGQLNEILDYFRENKDLIKPLKIMITEDRETLEHFSKFLAPQCEKLGVSTELVVVGEIHNAENIEEKESSLSTFFKDTYFSDFDFVKIEDKTYEYISKYTETDTKIDPDIDLSEYFASVIK